MTTYIYLFLMSTVLFVVPQLIVKVVNKEPKIDKNIIFLVIAFLLPIIWTLLSKEILSLRSINFLQHAIGGGVAVGFVCIYFINSLKDKYPIYSDFIFQLFFGYAVVSSLGVANELFEFSLDYLHIGIFSADRYDTWFDLLANTTGAMFVFVIYRFRLFLYSKLGH